MYAESNLSRVIVDIDNIEVTGGKLTKNVKAGVRKDSASKTTKKVETKTKVAKVDTKAKKETTKKQKRDTEYKKERYEQPTQVNNRSYESKVADKIIIKNVKELDTMKKCRVKTSIEEFEHSAKGMPIEYKLEIKEIIINKNKLMFIDDFENRVYDIQFNDFPKLYRFIYENLGDVRYSRIVIELKKPMIIMFKKEYVLDYYYKNAYLMIPLRKKKTDKEQQYDMKEL